MNRTSYLTCQNLIRHLRKWEIEHGSGWPGKGTNEPAKTLYPNLLAEMGWGFPWLRLPAEFADVSQEIMAAVLEDGEELPKLAYYRVNWPGGVRLRVGPGLGYRLKTTLPCGTVVLGEDVADLLREDLKHDDSIWLHITCEVGSGWVDGAYLERINVPTE